MKKFIRGSIFLAIVSGIGFFAYKMSGKLKQLKTQYENCIFFGGKRMNFDNEEFSGGSFAVMFSGFELDLRGATLAENIVTIELYAEYSGVSIRVPEEWQVKLDGEVERGGISNTTTYNEEDTTRPVLILKHHVRYGGLEVKYK